MWAQHGWLGSVEPLSPTTQRFPLPGHTSRPASPFGLLVLMWLTTSLLLFNIKKVLNQLIGLPQSLSYLNCGTDSIKPMNGQYNLYSRFITCLSFKELFVILLFMLLWLVQKSTLKRVFRECKSVLKIVFSWTKFITYKTQLFFNGPPSSSFQWIGQLIEKINSKPNNHFHKPK